MQHSVLGKCLRLREVPAGGVFGMFYRGQYVRFLRTSLMDTSQEHATVISLGPFDENIGRVTGPTAYYWEMDTIVIFESDTTIVPKPGAELLDAAHGPSMPLGAIVLTDEGRVCIYSPAPQAQRAMIDLETGAPTNRDRSVSILRTLCVEHAG